MVDRERVADWMAQECVGWWVFQPDGIYRWAGLGLSEPLIERLIARDPDCWRAFLTEVEDFILNHRRTQSAG